MKNIFSKRVTNEIISRIKRLKPETQPVWGKMSADQMLAHCCVTYEMIYDDIHPKPGAFKRFLLKLFIKNAVVNEKPYPKNSRTGPQFLITNEKNFNREKERLINYLKQTQQLGESHFDGKSSHSFGPLTSTEWNNMLYKHIYHHLRQFGV